jgi:O-antigen ligase
MKGSLATAEARVTQSRPGGAREGWRTALQTCPIDAAALMLALVAVPLSIAVSEAFLALAIVARLVRCLRGQTRLVLPTVFWYWLIWAGLEVVAWLQSPEFKDGWSEMRRLLLVAALFFVLPALNRAPDRLVAWRGIFLSSALGAVFLVGDFLSRLVYYRREIAAGGDVGLYLRSGGLLNHWMVYGTVEILVVAGLLSFWSLYPEERRRWWPVAALNALAIAFSLTRMLWACALLLLGIDLAWRRSRWLWALPLLPLAAYGLVPGAVRTRVRQSASLDYYSNQERIEMWRVGWKMLKEKPLTGVGPGRVDKLYRSYLSPGDPVPAYHGHLHNNLLQLAAQFGLPAALAAVGFVGVLLRDLLRAARAAAGREAQFSVRVALLGLTGYLAAGFFDYTYGHSLGLILLAFAVLPPLLTSSSQAQDSRN